VGREVLMTLEKMIVRMMTTKKKVMKKCEKKIMMIMKR
jgi:hypothetical protein